MVSDSQESIRHIVLFTLGEEVTEDERVEALRLLEGLGNSVDGIQEWTVTESLDTRKGRVIIENALLRDADTLERFRTSEQHKTVGAFMSVIADWQIGDYREPESQFISD